MKRSQALRTLPLLAILLVAGGSTALAQEESPTPETAAGPQITVTGHEYAFGDLPTTVPVGTSLAFMNTGAEAHELILARKNDGVTETWDELIAMPEEEAFAKVTTLGPLFANPGETAAFGIGPTGPAPMTALVLEQEGDYIALCFIPQGTTALPDFSAEAEAPASPDASASQAPQGPPHFMLGMRQEFTVTAAGTAPGPLPSAAAVAAAEESPGS